MRSLLQRNILYKSTLEQQHKKVQKKKSPNFTLHFAYSFVRSVVYEYTGDPCIRTGLTCAPFAAVFASVTESTKESLLARKAGSLYTSGLYREWDGRDCWDAKDPLDCRLETRELRVLPSVALPVDCIGLVLEAGVIPAVALKLSRLRRPSDVTEGLLPTL